MGDIMDKATDFIGLTDHEGADKAAAESRRLADVSQTMTQESIDFQRGQYDDWKEIYGPLQEDLGTYYKNLTGDALAAKNIVQTQEASQRAQQQTDRELAQRGMSGSGLEAQNLMFNQFATEQQKAGIRANADDMANQQKMSFLGLGLGQGAQMLGTQAGVSSNGASTIAGMANSNLGASTSLSQSNSAMMGELWGSGVGAASAYASGGSTGMTSFLGGK